MEVDGSHYRVTVTGDGTVALIIDNCTDADAGSYTCVAKNNEGESESHGKLSVLGEWLNIRCVELMTLLMQCEDNYVNLFSF